MTIEYYDGSAWVEAGMIPDDGKGCYEHKAVQAFTDFNGAVSNKIRLKYSDFVDSIRLIEVEVYGTMADMPEPEEPEKPDPMEGLTYFALKTNGGKVTASAGEGTKAGDEIAKLNDGVTTSGNEYRWRTDKFDFPNQIYSWYCLFR